MSLLQQLKQCYRNNTVYFWLVGGMLIVCLLITIWMLSLFH